MTIGIIGAMPSELKDLRSALGEAKIVKNAIYEFYVNEIGDKKIVNVCCGVAKVNAAIITQMLIDKFSPDYIINGGIAGGMNSEVNILDIVLSEDVVHHDVTPRFLANYQPHCNSFKGDKLLIETAKKVCEEMDTKCFVGRIASGEQFISDNDLKNKIKDEFSPYAVDMESASIGHTCFVNSVPFLAMRCISDNANDEAEMSFEEFEVIAAKKVADVTLNIINNL